MGKVKIAGTNIISSLGFTSKDNFERVLNGHSGLNYDRENKEQPLSLIHSEQFQQCCLEQELPESLTRFEKLCILSIKDAVAQSSTKIDSSDCLIILATTKGNVSLLESKNETIPSIHLWKSADKIAAFFNAPNRPLVISNACVSSVLAQVVAVRMLNAKQYKSIIVCGADLISDFILTGFQSFKALSSKPCKPFDIDRDGLSLGEGAGSIVFTTENNDALFGGVSCLAGASSNDANHISGPSRTGDGLANAIISTLKQTQIRPEFISAHGTGTMYNDEMESKAIALTKLQNVPVNSLKPYFGHTLGAAGVIETITSLFAMEESKAIATLGHEKYGVSQQINLIQKTAELKFDSFLKIASGFGGCNAAILFSK